MSFLAIYLMMSHLLTAASNASKIDAVVLTTGKDTRVFVKSISSALKHLVDVDRFFIICPNLGELRKILGNDTSPRIIFVDESRFPFKGETVVNVMIESVKERGLYPIDGKSHFEKTVWGRTGWFLQQLLKFYAGKVCNISDYVLLDSDVVWFKDLRFIAGVADPSPSYSGNRYYYASSSQYHPPYMATLPRIAGVDLYSKSKVHRSGIVHHIVIVKMVLEALMSRAEQKHGGLPFWQILLNQSASEMTCRAPRTSICGAGSTLSEYELYFNFARSEFPQSVQLRPLLWANGPAPGLLFWPKSIEKLTSDGYKSSWMGHRQNDVVRVLEKQMTADRAQGYDFVGYHNYAKRRYYEVVGEDLDALCSGIGAPLPGSTCSWQGFNATYVPEIWFKGCACYMALHAAGP